MIGKKIGVQATNEPVWNAFLKANKIDPSKVTKVPVQFDPTPLVTGEVDGWFSFFTNEPNLLKVQGIETDVFLLADYKLPAGVARPTIVHKSTLDERPGQAQGVPGRRHQGLAARSLKDPAHGRRARRQQVRQGPEPDRRGADARVQGRRTS